MSDRPAERDFQAGPIRSYVLRRSHFSAAQRDAYQRLMPRYGVAFSPQLLDLPALFGRRAETILEIGSGMGDTTAEIAAADPDRDYLAVEVHTPGVGALLKLIEAKGIGNLRIIEHDAQEVVVHQIPDMYLTGIHVFFPDPWPKARHHKRRLIQKQFLERIATKLRIGGYLHLATDWPDYARQMTEAVDATAALERMPDPSPSFPATGRSRPTTRFENRGRALGHPIEDIVALRRPEGLKHAVTGFNTAASPGSQSPPPPGLQAVDPGFAKSPQAG